MPYILVGSPVSTVTGLSVLDARRELAQELGWWQTYTVSARASGTEPERYAVLEELEDDEESMARLDGAYLYVRTGAQAGTQRRLIRGGYDGPIGGVAVSRMFAAPLEENDVVELSKPLPIRNYFDRRGSWELMAEAAQRSPVEARLALIGDGTRSVSLNGYPFITSYDQTRGIFDYRLGGISTDPYSLSPYGYNVKANGADITLEPSVTYSASESFQLGVAVPGHRLLHDGSSWGYVGENVLTTSATDAYQTAVPPHWIRVFGMQRALDHLITLTLDDPMIDDEVKKRRVADYERRLVTYNGASARIQINEFSQPPQDFRPGLATTVTTGGSGGAWSGGWTA